MKLIISRFHYSSLLLLLLSGLILPRIANSIGINYGQIANNLPAPEDVVPMLKSIGATKVKLYDADPKVLKAFANSDTEFVVGLGNEYLAKMRDPIAAQDWIKTNVKPFLPATKITCVTVGNEILTFNDTELTSHLFPAMESVHAALVTLNLDKQVSVTSAHSLAILESSYPPSSGSFRKDLKENMVQILDFHAKTGSSLLINAYPFFAYKGNPKQVSLDFVLFQPNQGYVDSLTKLKYDNMLFAQVDAVHSALHQLGYKNLSVQISETGWPSKGDEDEIGATPENAMKYNGNLMKLISAKKGTPLKPNSSLDVYVFALFNENLKPGPTSERNYGLFKPDKTPAYRLALLYGNSSANSSTVIIGGNDGDDDTEGPNSSEAPGYLSFSSADQGKLKFGEPGIINCFQKLLFAFMSSILLFI